MFLPSSNLLLLPLRIGRTARAGAEGQAVTFIEDADRRLLKEIVKKTGVQMQQREVPAAAVQQWQGKVEGSHGDVWRVLKEEREEKRRRAMGAREGFRALLAALDLPFEEACLAFHQTERAVRTPSSEQVRAPIFRSGVENWQAYEPWLGPLKAALGEVLARYPLAT